MTLASTGHSEVTHGLTYCHTIGSRARNHRLAEALGGNGGALLSHDLRREVGVHLGRANGFRHNGVRHCPRSYALLAGSPMADNRPTEAIRRSARRSAATTGGTPSASARAKTRSVVSKIRSVIARARSAG